jgi:spore coat polysaccharide biosynthesis protein SpsF
MQVVAIIQARMGSTRLPGKVLMPLAGKPLLWHTIHRLRKCKSLNAIVVATSTLAENDAIAALAESEGIPVFRGPEEDVLARFAACASAFEADVVVRVNADAPLIDPALIDKLVQRLIAADADYVMPPPGAPCFHDGVDPMSRRVLDKLMRVAHHDPLAREHVTGFLKAHRRFARITLIDVEPALAVAGPRLSIDTLEDLAFFEQLYRRLGAPAGELDLRAVAALYAAEGKLPTRTITR